jgi:hypothetical protein
MECDASASLWGGDLSPYKKNLRKEPLLCGDESPSQSGAEAPHSIFKNPGLTPLPVFGKFFPKSVSCFVKHHQQEYSP